MTLYAFRVFYVGRNYLGFQRQRNGQTIENYLELAFIQADLIRNFQSNQYRSTSRTDQGVSALGNVFVLDVPTRPNLTIINSFLPNDILVWSYAEVPMDFDPRRKVSKWYRYYLPYPDHLYRDRLDMLHDYQGRHDFTPFIKKHGAGMEYPITAISSIEYRVHKDLLIIDIHGDSFGREQIRRMIGFLLQQKFNHIRPKTVLSRQMDLDITSAPPEGLLLYQISFPNTLDWLLSSNLDYKLHLFKAKILNHLTSYSIESALLDSLLSTLKDHNHG